MFIKEFSKNRVVFSNGEVITCDPDKGQEFDLDTIEKILEYDDSTYNKSIQCKDNKENDILER